MYYFNSVTSAPSSTSANSKSTLIIFAVVGAVVALVLLAVTYFYIRKRKRISRNHHRLPDVVVEMEKQPESPVVEKRQRPPNHHIITGTTTPVYLPTLAQSNPPSPSSPLLPINRTLTLEPASLEPFRISMFEDQSSSPDLHPGHASGMGPPSHNAYTSIPSSPISANYNMYQESAHRWGEMMQHYEFGSGEWADGPSHHYQSARGSSVIDPRGSNYTYPTLQINPSFPTTPTSPTFPNMAARRSRDS